MERRAFLKGSSGALGAAVAIGAAPAGAASPDCEADRFASGKVETKFISFDDSVEEFEAHFRFERDLVEDEGEAVSWYYWLAYVVPENGAPRPLVRFDG